MNTETEVLSTKKKVNAKRIEIQDEKSQVDKLGEETVPVQPQNVEVMYAGKLCAVAAC